MQTESPLRNADFSRGDCRQASNDESTVRIAVEKARREKIASISSDRA